MYIFKINISKYLKSECRNNFILASKMHRNLSRDEYLAVHRLSNTSNLEHRKSIIGPERPIPFFRGDRENIKLPQEYT